jgi:drug/metabolite transporter (DMT)-like permease
LPVLYALGAAFCWGLSFRMQGAYVLAVLSAPQMLLLNSCVGLVLVGLTVLALALPRPRLPIEGQVSLVGAGVVNLAGFSSFAWGLSVGISSVVTVLSTLSGAIACLMAVVFLKERLQAVQMAGCVLIVCGAMILSAN